MKPLPETLYRAEQVRELDRIAIEEFATPGAVLMERAGLATYNAMRRERPRLTTLLVMCGVGNNAGDGYVIARLALQAGMHVTVLNVGDYSRLSGDALTMAEKYAALLASFEGEQDPFSEHDLGQYPLIVDAILGTGIKGDVQGVWAEAINAMNVAQSNGAFVVAVDIPSGLNADTGHIATVAVQANMTMTYIGVKQGLLTADGPQLLGKLEFNDLSINPDVYVKVRSDVRLLSNAIIDSHLARRAKNSHKGHFGRLLVVGGAMPYTGAARLAAEAALRCGAGIVAVASRSAQAAFMNLHCPELICHGIETRQDLIAILGQFDAVVIGPGLGTGPWSADMLNTILDCDLPLVIDADGLNGLAKQPLENSNCILTPHPGEAGRLLGCKSSDIQQNRFTAVQDIFEQYQATVVLKGCGTLVKSDSELTELCPRGNPGMASAGMGDVLAGILGALIVQGLELSVAARVGVQIHAWAGDLASEAEGERGLLASDLLPHIRRIVNSSHCEYVE